MKLGLQQVNVSIVTSNLRLVKNQLQLKGKDITANCFFFPCVISLYSPIGKTENN